VPSYASAFGCILLACIPLQPGNFALNLSLVLDAGNAMLTIGLYVVYEDGSEQLDFLGFLAGFRPKTSNRVLTKENEICARRDFTISHDS
jgi:hypothetical protein